MDARTNRLLTGAPLATLLRLAAPNILMTTVQASVGLIETYFVAELGTDALAGMALVFPLLMFIQMVSNGAVGGSILSTISRSLGGGRRDDANAFVWHAVAIATALGLATTLAARLSGGLLYRAMGGADASLDAALTYSNVVFSGAVLLWLFSALAAVIRGTGNMWLPAAVMCLGALVLVPLSPALIFGWGPLPRLGIVGGGIAVVGYYAVGAVIFAGYLWSGRGVLHPSAKPPALSAGAAWVILKVGAISAVVSASTNITIAARLASSASRGQRRWPGTEPAPASNIFSFRSCSVWARRWRRWSERRSVPATCPGRDASLGRERRWREC